MSGGPALDHGLDPTTYTRNAAFVPALAADLVAVLEPRPGERILDLGCGDGTLTALIAASGARVIGVDVAPAMVAATRARGLEALVASGAALPDLGPCDAVFSNAALHWMGDLAPVVGGVRRHLRPGGRFVAEMGGQGNVAAIVVGLHAAARIAGIDPPPSPWIFPTPLRMRGWLETAGFSVTAMTLTPRPTALPTGMRGWLETFAAGWLRTVPDALQAELLATAEALLAPALCDDTGSWVADYVRLRFVAVAV